MPIDPSVCRPDPDLTADTVAATGYDGLYAEHPSPSALRRAAECPQPAWRAMARPCDAAWYYGPSAEEARLQLLWQAWCWHGVDLAVDGSVECDPEATVTGTFSGGTMGRFRCVVDYAGARAERDVLRGRHTADVIEAW